MMCEYCGHPLLDHDAATGMCLVEDCDCIDYEDHIELDMTEDNAQLEQSSSLPGSHSER